MLPDLKTGTTFPTFQSLGMLPVQSDCVNSNDRYTEMACRVFFNSLLVISSVPAEDDILIFSMIQMMPCAENVTDGISDLGWPVGIDGGISVSFVKTDENAVLNIFAHSTSLTSSPSVLVSVMMGALLGFRTCQNFLGLLVNIFVRSV